MFKMQKMSCIFSRVGSSKRHEQYEFISTLTITLLISIVLHYSYKKNNKVVVNGHFKQQNSTCV